MNFKPPRCKDTDPKLQKIIDIFPEENIRCQVGRGECNELAIVSEDNGYGGEFFLCKQHYKEFIALSKLLAEMTPAKLDNFNKLIHKAELSWPNKSLR